MAIDKLILQECIRDQREMIESAQIVERQVCFEPKGNYVFVGIKLHKTHGSSGVKLLGRNAHFATKPKLTTVSKTG